MKNESEAITLNSIKSAPLMSAFVFVVLGLIACSWHDNDTDDNPRMSSKDAMTEQQKAQVYNERTSNGNLSANDTDTISNNSNIDAGSNFSYTQAGHGVIRPQ